MQNDIISKKVKLQSVGKTNITKESYRLELQNVAFGHIHKVAAFI